ncbi:hypothetical protein BV898_12688 [Hypsibius exemplaris]|uniref:Uncharacterized protein n=1 Tax=Hypsibius exemplaris TaxID=2072580 RepID=A0A1W0WCW7_HYPEX|nr:hypothetical protein BV898_12688 [Hypsibius exemplaris]
MDPPSGEVFLQRSFFHDLVTAFLKKDDPDSTTDPATMTTDALLNLLAPPICCEFGFTDELAERDGTPAGTPAAALQSSSHRPNTNCVANNRLCEYQPSRHVQGTRRGRPRRSHAPTTVVVKTELRHDSPTVDGDSCGGKTVPSPSVETNVRDLVFRFSRIQEENLAASAAIIRTKENLLTEFGHVMSQLDLDCLIGVAHHPAKKHLLQASVDRLFANGKSSLAGEGN